tara:strand:+ start:762 stop:956 length:195 start_codon:yes stop_codon:yes gene_type:complete
MEKQTLRNEEEMVLIPKKELEQLKMDLQSWKSTAEILGDEEAMKDIRESERLEKEGAKLEKVNF